MTPLTSKPDPAELIVLAVLADGKQYGYAIAKLVSARSAGGLRLTPGILYPTLSEMERRGLIGAEWETIVSDRATPTAPTGDAEETPRGRRRKWYSLTPKGCKCLDQSIKAHRRHEALINLFIGPLEGATEPPPPATPATP
ncbi:MAG: helix-turn-helix transcriptional regulator [Phycisphaerales bacterium]|nr:helix-turn-helix transcriptional regulator [Phycisphaerales bacterium]